MEIYSHLKVRLDILNWYTSVECQFNSFACTKTEHMNLNPTQWNDIYGVVICQRLLCAIAQFVRHMSHVTWNKRSMSIKWHCRISQTNSHTAQCQIERCIIDYMPLALDIIVTHEIRRSNETNIFCILCKEWGQDVKWGEYYLFAHGLFFRSVALLICWHTLKALEVLVPYILDCSILKASFTNMV